MKKLHLIIYLFLSLHLFAQNKYNSSSFPEEECIYNIFLQNEKSTKRILGENIWEKQFEADSRFPRIECINKNKTEGLRLFFHYGGTKNAVAEFELFSINNKYVIPPKAVVVNVANFKSGNNVTLGLSKRKVVAILGRGYEVIGKNNNKEEIRYYTDDPDAKMLKRYGGLAYFIKCIFKNDKLVQYNFGFEYP